MKSSGEAYRNIRLCVDTFENGVMQGQYYFTALGNEGRRFASLVQFLIDAEQTLDTAGFPQSYTAKRSFTALAAGGSAEAGVERMPTGALATFEIRLLFRQHASWQGTISWQEGGQEISFRSVLELILLISSALQERTVAPANGSETNDLRKVSQKWT